MAVRPRTAPAGGPMAGHNLAPDLFVLVRPPPSSYNHPLNLQIQLLVPSIARSGPPDPLQTPSRRSGEYSTSSSRNGSITTTDDRVGSSSNRSHSPHSRSLGANSASATSFDAIAGASVSRSGSRSSDAHDALDGDGPSGEALTRTSSRGSTRSRGSTNSVSTSTSMSASGTSTRRRVTPLLNLNFHSVLPTVVTDAGTDQRVAKFLKRGIEMSNLAIIDPIDLSQPAAANPATLGANMSPQTSPTRPGSSSSSSTPNQASSTPTNNLFSKFKRFTLGSPSPSAKSSSTSQQPLPSSPSGSSFSFFSRSTSTASNLSSSSSTSTAHPNSPTKFLPSLVNSEGAPTPRTVPLLRTGSDETTTTSPQSPVSATFSPAAPSHVAPASSSPTPVGYAFVVRKWLRDDLAQISDAGGIPGSSTAIRLEWVRASDQEYRRMGKRRTRSRTMASRSSGERGDGLVEPLKISTSRRSSEIAEGGIPQVVPEDEELQTPETTSPPPNENDRVGGEPDDEDEGESSDPEDSERPFICTLFYPSSSPSSRPPSSVDGATSTSPPASSSMQHSPSLRRIQLATLRPAPHHPKLIATLLLPPTLPSIPLGQFSPDQGLQGGVLSNEVLRDLVHTTSMWLSIREGLGGLGKEKDSQNIAAGLGLVKVRSGKVGRTLRGLKR
ncbi:hypothetical protein JCM3766R1_001850 [Sporobolomyces carnicolor]